MDFRYLTITFSLSIFLLSCVCSEEGFEGSGYHDSDDEDEPEASALPPETSTERTSAPAKPKFRTKQTDEEAFGTQITTRSTTVTSKRIPTVKATAKVKEEVAEISIIKTSGKPPLPLREITASLSTEFTESSKDAIGASSSTLQKNGEKWLLSPFTWIIIVTAVAVLLIVVMVSVYIIKRRTGKENAYKPGVRMSRA